MAATMEGKEISHLAKLQELLVSMERELGLDGFSGDERKVLYALTSISNNGQRQAQSSDLMNHKLCHSMSKPTFYRCLRKLLDSGVVEQAGSRKSGLYSLT